MIFSAFLDPHSITATDDGGGVGSDHLIGMFRSLLESCFLAETTSWRIGRELVSTIHGLSDPDTKLKLNALLETFQKRERFVELVDDSQFDLDTPLEDIALEQTSHELLDIVITENTPEGKTKAEFTQARRFNRSNFSQTRQRRFADGLVLSPRQLNHQQLFVECFGRMLMGCDDFVIEDYMIGRDFSSNYYDNLPFWIGFLKTAGRTLSVKIVTQLGSPATLRSLNNRLNDLAQGTMIGFSVETTTSPRHERFFRSKAFSLNIGRGIDLCDENGMNRDICVRFAK